MVSCRCCPSCIAHVAYLAAADYRSCPAASDVPELLEHALRAVSQTLAEDGTQAAASPLAEQAGRAGANFAANNGESKYVCGR